MSEERGYWQARIGNSVSRRRILYGTVAGLGVAMAAGLGCRRSGTETPAQPSAGTEAKQPKRGGIIVRAGGRPSGGTADSQGTGLDPHIANSPLFTRGFRLFYQGLLGYDLRTYEVEPEIAQRWQQPSPTEYIFSLQPGVKFHNKPPANGRELTADDVVFSLERARQNDPRILSRSFLITIDKIEARDKSTVRITAKEPDASLLTKLSGDSILMLAPEVVERAGKFATADTAVGTGPFIVRSIQESVGGEYVRNPDYWKPGLPYADGVRTRHFNDDQTAYAAFQAGELDIITIPGRETKAYIAKQGPGYTPDWWKDDSSLQSMANTRVKPMDDARVTRALRLLQDHDEFLTAYAEPWAGRGRHGSIFTTSLDDWDLTHEEYTNYLEWKQPKDDAVREALALLNAAGFTRDNPLKFELASSTGGFTQACTELLQGMWKRLGQGVVETQLKLYDRDTFATVWASGNFTYMVVGVSGGISDVDATLVQIYRTNGSRNFGKFSDSKLDGMIDKQRGIFDRQQRKAAVREIILYMFDASPYVIPSSRYWLNGVKARVQGFSPEFYMNGRQYERIWLEE